MNSRKNYYAILGVLPTAEPVVIRAAYRALAMKYHPDKWTGDPAIAERKMREINQAYEILANEQSRRQYDDTRRGSDFEEDVFGSDATQDAFREAEQVKQPDWDFALEYYPDLDAICANLRRTSNKLAFAFRATLLETKQFNSRNEIAQEMEADFLQTYFGRNQQIIAFAKSLIEGGHKSAARELNRAITVLGSKADDNIVIPRIMTKFFGDQVKAAEQKEVRAIANRLLRTNYVTDAKHLVEKLDGTIQYPRRGLFESTEVLLFVSGERQVFRTDYDMVQWIIKFIVPKVLSS